MPPWPARQAAALAQPTHTLAHRPALSTAVCRGATGSITRLLMAQILSHS